MNRRSWWSLLLLAAPIGCVASAHSARTADASLLPPSALTVHVAGGPAQVRVISPRADTTAAMTDASGSMALARILPGAYDLLVQRSGASDLHERVNIPGGCGRQVEVTLRPTPAASTMTVADCTPTQP